MYYLIDKFGVRESTDSVRLFEFWQEMCDEGCKVYNPESYLKAVDSRDAKHELTNISPERMEGDMRSYEKYKKTKHERQSLQQL
jgi:hypothetical protein